MKEPLVCQAGMVCQELWASLVTRETRETQDLQGLGPQDRLESLGAGERRDCQGCLARMDLKELKARLAFLAVKE